MGRVPGTLVHAAKRGERPFTATDLWTIPRVGAPAPSPNGLWVALPVTECTVGREKACTRIWLVSSDRANAPGQGNVPARPLTGTDVTAGGPAWRPDGKVLAFTRVRLDAEEAKPQLHLLRLDGGDPEPLTDLPLGVFDAKWLPDGSGLVVATYLLRGHLTLDATKAELERRKADPVKAHVTEDRVFRYWDRWLTTGEVPHLFHLDLKTKVLRDLMPGSPAWFGWMEPQGHFDIAPDGKEIAYDAVEPNPKRREELETKIWTVPLAGGAPRCLTPDVPANAFRPRYAPGGFSLVYGRTEERYFYADRPRLYTVDRKSGEHRPWLADWDRAPMDWEMGRDGACYFVAEDDGRQPLWALRPGAKEPVKLVTGGTASSLALPGDQRIYFTWQSLQQPPELYRVPTLGGDAERLTHLTDAALEGVALGEVHDVRVKGGGGEPVQSWLILPPGHDTSAPAPFVNVVHGGPHGISGDTFHFRWNPHCFAAPGYVVAMPNFQGSTSWGNDYAQRIQGTWGDRPFADVMAVTDAVVASGLADGDHMAAAGGSYGGYMMSWIAGHTDRFRCLVNHAGVHDTLAMYASDVTQGRAASLGGEAWDGLERIDSSNPARFTKGWNTPMLVTHGERDYRVPVSMGLEAYGICKAKGIPARLVYFPDENHWVLKPHNSLRWYAEVLAWLDRWLVRDGTPAGPPPAKPDSPDDEKLPAWVR